ncbi:MAG: class I SAM-dependent methyltransferase [Pseudomonadota bacterium]
MTGGITERRIDAVQAFANTVTVSGRCCSACMSEDTRIFYEVEGVPTQQVTLMKTREEALACPKGDLRLAVCNACGFIWNSAFDPALLDYQGDYEATQAHSPTFNAFHKRLAEDMVERYGLRGKDVIEIGCGHGECVAILCEQGVKSATGFDPVILDTAPPHPNAKLVAEFYTEAHEHLKPDFAFSKMVMEHIPDPHRFLTMLRRAIGDRPEAIAFAMMPDGGRVLSIRAFWDIYYEHCAYFTLGALARTFRASGFDVTGLSTAYGGQYAMISARPSLGDSQVTRLPEEETVEETLAMVADFEEKVRADRAHWQNWINERLDSGKRIVLWGGGSKAVAFLSSLDLKDGIDYAVDINPKRCGTFLAGVGQEIVTPATLIEQRPDHVIVMNPIYMDEIRADLRSMDLDPEMVPMETL